MKKKQKRPASSDEDSDVERNFALFTEKRKTEADDPREQMKGEESEEEGEELEEEGEESEQEEEEEQEESEEGEEREEDEEDQGLKKHEEEAESEQEGEGSSEEEAGSEEEDEVEDEGGNELRTREDVQKELSHMSFEDVLKLQNKVGTKVYNKVKHDSGSGSEPSTSGKRKRLNKNRPMEVSAKRPVSFLRQVVSVKKSTLRDPRFDDLSGEYKADIFEKTYGFINDIKHREKEVIKKKLNKSKSQRKKEELQFLVKRMENQERARLSREQQRNKELEFKRKQRQRANEGQAPLYLKNSERKKLQLLEKYEDLKKSGKLENFLSKKRKRNATKDRKKLPPQQHTNAPRGFH
ncbi:hypothetical protein WMY93_006840 [Mugilogobius chulae]|uniref:rRNA biogenesis protein RRP36 n=1 Tax=Mugilogobius chulae TaxID=88201 RepID=A0AAW0PLN2_9GOBI